MYSANGPEFESERSQALSFAMTLLWGGCMCFVFTSFRSQFVLLWLILPSVTAFYAPHITIQLLQTPNTGKVQFARLVSPGYTILRGATTLPIVGFVFWMLAGRSVRRGKPIIRVLACTLFCAFLSARYTVYDFKYLRGTPAEIITRPGLLHVCLASLKCVLFRPPFHTTPPRPEDRHCRADRHRLTQCRLALARQMSEGTTPAIGRTMLRTRSVRSSSLCAARLQPAYRARMIRANAHSSQRTRRRLPTAPLAGAEGSLPFARGRRMHDLV
jgi:hypothetical protein